jgi:hypothetical protein
LEAYFEATYSATYITEYDFLVSSNGGTASACWAKFVPNWPGYGFYLANDAGTAWLGPWQGSSTPLQNSQCVLTMSFGGPYDHNNPVFAIDFLTSFTGAKNTYLLVDNYQGSTGWQQVGTWNVATVAQAPMNANLVSYPTSGSTTTLSFASISYNGFPYISSMQMLLNYGLDGAGACSMYFSNASNTIYLSNDNGNGWVGSGVIGTTGTIENSQCRLDLGASSVGRQVNVLGVNLALTFKPGLPGPQQVFQYTVDNGGLVANWQQIGTYTTSTVSSQPPTPVSALPASGTGLAQNFRFTASSVNGYGYIVQMQGLINSSLAYANGCVVSYHPFQNAIYLLNDSGTAWLGGGTIGTPGTVANSQCTLDTGASSASGSGNNLTVSAALSFNSSWAGAKNTWLWVYDRGNQTGGWQPMSTWTVGAPPPPTLTSFSPTSGTAWAQVFTATYSDLQWSKEIGEIDFLVNSSTATSAACYVKWSPTGNNFYLMNDAGNAWLGPVTGGSSGTVQNSRCILNGATSSSSTTEFTVTLNFGLTFLQAFNGGQYLYTSAIGSGGNTGLQNKGTWIVEPADPAPDTVGDPRRIGVHSTGSYWGAAGEQIDLLSGNLNVTVPLLTAKSRGGWGVTFALSYNSQLWREDSTGTSIEVPDVGYGLGWRLQAGSLLPVKTGSPPTLDHFVYSDATGAQYRLDQNNNNVWTSREGVYVSYDATATRLYWPDGTFWVMGSQSSAGEPDAGTLYPTLMQDTNGNQITIEYVGGAGSASANTSGRIWLLTDPRGAWSVLCGCAVTYTFNYNSDSPPHLTSISSSVGDNGAHTLTYLSSQPLTSPLPPNQTFDTTTLLQSVSTFDQVESFEYGTGYGEMTRMVGPFGGDLRWQYRTYTYGSGASYREVQSRQMTPSSGASQFTWNVNFDNNPTLHASTSIADVGAGTTKAWTLGGTAGPLGGLVTAYEERGTSGTALLHKDYTWTQDASGNAYLASVLTTLDPGTSSAAQTKSDQTLDAYGNILVSHVYDYGNLSSPTWTYNYSYLTDSNYVSRYIRNRVSLVTVQKGSGSQVYLQQNNYDSANLGHSAGCTGAGLTDRQGLTLHDSSYSTSFGYRGNPTEAWSAGTSMCYGYEISGVPYYTTNGANYSANLTPSSSTNYSLPGVLSPNGSSSLATTISYASSFAVTSLVGPNGASTNTTYDGFGRPSSTQVADGATTT